MQNNEKIHEYDFRNCLPIFLRIYKNVIELTSSSAFLGTYKTTVRCTALLAVNVLGRFSRRSSYPKNSPFSRTAAQIFFFD